MSKPFTDAQMHVCLITKLVVMIYLLNDGFCLKTSEQLKGTVLPDVRALTRDGLWPQILIPHLATDTNEYHGSH